MGQCGCGDTTVEKAFKLPSGQVIGYSIYGGCAECFAGPGVTFFVYPNKKSEWLQFAKIEPFEPDEYGGNSGNGIPVSFFEVSDLIAAAKEIGGTKFDGSVGYDCVEDWLEDYGLQMMQDAMQIFEKRVEDLGAGATQKEQPK